MRLQTHGDAEAFLAAADALLARDEPRHNLIYGICSTLVDDPTAYPEAHLWTVADGETLAVLLMTPPFNIAVAKPRRDDALVFAAKALRAEGVEPPGVSGALPEAEVLVRAWGREFRTRMAHGVYAARQAHVPEDVPGTMRRAAAGDRELLIQWLHAFHDEAMEEGSPRLDAEQVVDRRLARDDPGFALWEDGGRVVSLCGYGGRTPHGIRIGPVYTPTELRGHGYGSAVTAGVTKELLDGGRDFCFLYTDLANPTSNRIYMRIGYERICDAADYAFV